MKNVERNITHAILTLFLCAFMLPAYGVYQKEDIVIPDKLPTFSYKKQDFYEYFLSRLKYPKRVNKEINGKTMIVGFIVREDGSITDVKISKSVHPLVDSASVKTIRDMPKWQPALKNNKPIALPMKIPIKFNLK